MCDMCVQEPAEISQKRVLDPLKLELQEVVRHHGGTENRT